MWKKFLEISQLLGNETEASYRLSLADKEISNLKNEIAALKKDISNQNYYTSLIEKNLTCNDSMDWKEDAFDRLSQENQEALIRYEKVLVLHKVGLLSEEEYNKFCAETELWKAVHNYSKIANPFITKLTTRSGAKSEICGSCGVAVINGHCKCSD